MGCCWSCVIEASVGRNIEWWGRLGCQLQVIEGVGRYRSGRGGFMISGWFDNMPGVAWFGGVGR